MATKKLCKYVRNELDKLKNQHVPALMEEGNEEELERIFNNVDYSIFYSNPTPMFELKELDIKDSDDIRVLLLYAINNHNVDDSDSDFFFDPIEFYEILGTKCGKWGATLANIIANGFCIYRNNIECLPSLTLHQILHPEEVAI